MRVLITGASGRLGRALLGYLPNLFSSEDEIDVLMHKSFLPISTGLKMNSIYILSGRYDLCLHLAAITDTGYCQKTENHEGVLIANVFLTSKVCDCTEKVVLISTDNVFPGGEDIQHYSETDLAKPCNFYGLSKYLAEQVVLYNKGVVIRIQTMLGVENRVINSVLDQLQGRTPSVSAKPFWDNIYSRPSFITDLVIVIRKCLEMNLRGYTLHCSCSGDFYSRAEVAHFVLDFLSQNSLPLTRHYVEVETCNIAFPRRLVLATDHTEELLGISFTNSRQAIEKHLKMSLL